MLCRMVVYITYCIEFHIQLQYVIERQLCGGHLMSDAHDSANFLEGVSAFQTARLHAFWDDVLALVRGKPAELLSFEDIRTRLRLREENYRGLQEVPLDQIAGSVGRYREFTSKFLPKKN